MADRALFRMPKFGPAAEQRRRESQQRRRNLRTAIRQLERAELYLVALYSLNLDDPDTEASVDDLVGRVRSLERYLLEQKRSA
jgi:hypothetical protein